MVRYLLFCITVMDPPPYTPAGKEKADGWTDYTLSNDPNSTEADALSYLRRPDYPHSPLPGPSTDLERVPSAPKSCQEQPLSDTTPSELPPSYAPLDELARSFRIVAPFVYATQTSGFARYQLHQETPTMRLSRLSIRRMLPAEARSCPLPAEAPRTSLSSALGPSMPEDIKPEGMGESTVQRVRYDDDLTLYTVNYFNIAGSRSYEMKGERSRTVPGVIKPGTSLLGRSFKLYHCTKPASRDALDPANVAKMQKYGYKSEDEWDKKLLFVVKKGRWEDGKNGALVAKEEDGDLSIEEGKWAEGWRRDLLVASWVMKRWIDDRAELVKRY